MNPGVCLHSIDKRYFVDLKPFERHAESSLFKRGSVVNCIPDDVAPDHITDSENYLDDDCGDDSSSLLMYKICQPEFMFPLRAFTVDPSDETLTLDEEQTSAAFWGTIDAENDNSVFLRKTFERPVWNPIINETYDERDDASLKLLGLTFQFNAENKTADEGDCKTQGPNSIRFEATCDPQADGEVIWTRMED